jgi:hypothetical protein
MTAYRWNRAVPVPTIRAQAFQRYLMGGFIQTLTGGLATQGTLPLNLLLFFLNAATRAIRLI